MRDPLLFSSRESRAIKRINPSDGGKQQVIIAANDKLIWYRSLRVYVVNTRTTDFLDVAAHCVFSQKEKKNTMLAARYIRCRVIYYRTPLHLRVFKAREIRITNADKKWFHIRCVAWCYISRYLIRTPRAPSSGNNNRSSYLCIGSHFIIGSITYIHRDNDILDGRKLVFFSQVNSLRILKKYRNLERDWF